MSSSASRTAYDCPWADWQCRLTGLTDSGCVAPRQARAYLSASAAASAAVRAYLSASAAAGSGMGKGGRVGRPLKLLLLAGCAVVAGIPAFLLGGGAQSLEAYRLGRMSPDDRARAQEAAHLQDPGLAVIGGEKAQVDAEIAKLLAEAASISDEAAKLEDEVAAALPALSDSARSDLGMDQGDVALVTSRIQHLHAQLPEIQRQLDVDFGAAVR